VDPENETTVAPPQDSMIMSPAQTANLMAILGAALARSGLSTRAECCASIGWNYAQQFAAVIETDKAAKTATALFTSHGYFAPPDSPLKGWSKPVWETEWAPFGFGPWDPGLGQRLTVVRVHLGAEHLHGFDSGEPGRVPLPVGREHERPDRPQHGTG
jgi:hypothetical protein